jgi:hypothetical protein
VTGGVILAAYALAAGFGAPAALCRDWARRSPRIAIGLWLTLAASWLAAVPLAGLTLLAPLSLTWQASGGRVARHLSGIPGGMSAAVAGMLLAAAIVLQASWHVAAGWPAPGASTAPMLRSWPPQAARTRHWTL